MAEQKTGIFNKDEDFQVPLMNVFRSAALDRDSKATEMSSGSDDREISRRQIERREGASFDRLQTYFMIDLGNLLGTVHMEATQDLSEYPEVRKSILNYGVQDVTSLIVGSGSAGKVRDRLKQALLDHEPRLIPESVVVRARGGEGSAHQSMAFEIEAVMAARPVDVPLEFVAEIDTGEGKVVMSALAVHE